MTENKSNIEVYQTLVFTIRLNTHLDARTEIEKAASDSAWRRVTDVEKRIEDSSANGVTGFIVFDRESTPDLPSVQLALWPIDTRRGDDVTYQYRLGNILPNGGPALSIHVFNNVLEEFIDSVLSVLSQKYQLDIELSSRVQSMSELTSTEAAKALRVFSTAANKSTGASHPADEARWWEFIVQAHKDQGTLTADILERWLVEVDEWDSETAHELASDWQKSKEFLEFAKKYDTAA